MAKRVLFLGLIGLIFSSELFAQIRNRGRVRNRATACITKSPFKLNHYLDYFKRREMHKVLMATRFCQLPENIQNQMWFYLFLSEQSGEANPGIPFQRFYDNQPLGSYFELTQMERDLLHASKLAHAFWLDYNELVPWSLADYSRDELVELFSMGDQRDDLET